MACRSMSPRVVTVSRTVSPCRRLPTRRVFSQLPAKVVSYTQVFERQAAHGAAGRSVTCTPEEPHSRPPLPRLLGQRGGQESVGHGAEANAVAKEEAFDGRESRASRARRDGGRRSGLESLERLDRKPQEGSSSTIDPASGMLQPVLDALEGLKKDFEGRFEKVDQLTFRIEAMASTLEAHSSAPSEEEVWEARCEQLKEIADRAVSAAVQSQLSQRIEKIDAQLGMLLAMETKEDEQSAAPSEKEVWEARCEQLQEIADRAVNTAVQSQLSQRIEKIDAQLGMLLALETKEDERSAAPSEKEVWEARCEQLQEIADRAVKTAVQSQLSQRIEKIDAQLGMLLALETKEDERSAAPSEKEVWEARCEQLQEIADRAVKTAVQSQLSQRIEKIDAQLGMLLAMGEKEDASSAYPSDKEIWEEPGRQLQDIADRAVKTAVQSQLSHRVEKIDAQLAQLLAMGEKEEASSANPSEKEIWEEPGRQLQDIADRAVKTAVQSQLSQRIENIDAQLAQLLERLKGDEPTGHEPSSVAVQTESESEDKSLRETVEKQEFQLQLAAGENLWLKDENAACRDIVRHVLAEKNTYQGHLAATQRHLGFLGSNLQSTMPEDGADEQQDPERARRATAPGCCWYSEVHLGSAGDGTLAEQDMVAAYKASHRGKRPNPEYLVNWVKNQHDKVITYRQACCLIAASTR
ncbi:unnamed protein product [Symbiodinium sp. CCMP2592]|nr:unnamed protein product [Symbiodinium sp. CCMP2592]